MEDRRKIEVVAAVIHKDGRILATQRGYGEFKDKWEFPGGKMEAGESREEALRREIREELDTEINIGKLLCTVEYDYPAFHLTMHCYLCSVVSGTLDQYRKAALYGGVRLSGISLDDALLPVQCGVRDSGA